MKKNYNIHVLLINLLITTNQFFVQFHIILFLHETFVDGCTLKTFPKSINWERGKEINYTRL